MIRDLLTSIFDLIVPPRATEELVRTLTLEELQALLPGGGAGLPYRDPRVTAVVWELKYHANKKAAALAGALIAEELLALASEELGTPLLLPVPMHPARKRERGHNQTELLCEAALQHLAHALEYEPRVLVRAVNTPPQQGLPRRVRLKNIHGSMRVEDPERVARRVCIVVDDVSTTGATFAEAARALKAAGARHVHILALAQS